MTVDLERRALVQGGALLAAGAALAGAATPNPARAQASAVSSSGAKPMSYSIKPLSFDPKGIKGLSEKILVSHYENNYGGAVKRLKDTLKKAENATVWIVKPLILRDSESAAPNFSVFP
jgi:superoxide dismutase, Fe-Mn family